MAESSDRALAGLAARNDGVTESPKEPIDGTTPRVRRWLGVLIAVFTVIAAARVVATYGVFSNTFDEPIHLAAGMEWLEHGTYTTDVMHPPLARSAIALGPFLAGIRTTQKNGIAAGREALYADGRYSRNLALARLGVLPFLIAAIVGMWLWATSLYGPVVGAVAALLMTTTPAVLAHGGLATTDMPLVAGLTFALHSLSRWFDRPSWQRGVVAGATGGLAALCKLSAIPYLAACLLAFATVRWLIGKRSGGSVRTTPPHTPRTLIVPSIVAGLTVWAGYGFSVGRRLTSVVPGGVPLVAPEIFVGLGFVAIHSVGGRGAYLLGNYSTHGWWYFFPIAIAVKTPIPLLVLGIGGIAATIKRAVATADWHVLAPAAAISAILAVAMIVRINIGVRHVLPIYPLLAMVAAYALVEIWDSSRWRGAGRALAAALVVWQVGTSARAHPDYLAYFNEFAGSRPERILLDSDLDWGQDLLRLADTVRVRRIPSLSTVYWGTADVTRHGLPNVHLLQPNERVTGWVAVSEMIASRNDPGFAGYRWLNAYSPVARVGKSIRLLYIPPGS